MADTKSDKRGDWTHLLVANVDFVEAHARPARIVGVLLELGRDGLAVYERVRAVSASNLRTSKEPERETHHDSSHGATNSTADTPDSLICRASSLSASAAEVQAEMDGRTARRYSSSDLITVRGILRGRWSASGEEAGQRWALVRASALGARSAGACHLSAAGRGRGPVPCCPPPTSHSGEVLSAAPGSPSGLVTRPSCA